MMPTPPAWVFRQLSSDIGLSRRQSDDYELYSIGDSNEWEESSVSSFSSSMAPNNENDACFWNDDDSTKMPGDPEVEALFSPRRETMRKSYSEVWGRQRGCGLSGRRTISFSQVAC